MFFEVFVYCLVCVLLVVFSFKMYQKTMKAYLLMMLALQMIATVVQLTSLFYPQQEMAIYIRIFVFFFGVVLPSVLFFSDYGNFNLIEWMDLKSGDRNMKNENYLKAIDQYQKALVQNPNHSETYVKLGKAYNAVGDKRTAFDRFAKAVELNRNDYRSYYEIGAIFFEMNKKKDAELMLDNALRIKPDFTEASMLLAEVLCNSNQYDEAIRVYREAIKYSSNNDELFYRLGVIHTELRDFNEALDCYKSVVTLNPDHSEAYFSMGQIYLLKGELESANEAFSHAVNGEKEIAAKAYFQMAKVNMLKENEITAVENLQKAIDLDSTYIYKVQKEPMFQSVTDYLEGIQMVSNAQMRLEQEVNEKVKEKYEKEYSEEELNKIHFNYFDKFNS